jgi:hypothetical protein
MNERKQVAQTAGLYSEPSGFCPHLFGVGQPGSQALLQVFEGLAR